MDILIKKYNSLLEWIKFLVTQINDNVVKGFSYDISEDFGKVTFSVEVRHDNPPVHRYSERIDPDSQLPDYRLRYENEITIRASFWVFMFIELKRHVTDQEHEINKSINEFTEQLLRCGYEYSYEKLRLDAEKKNAEIREQELLKSIVRQPLRRQKTYLMQDISTGFHKIGRSVNPNVREKTLLSQSPAIKLIWVYKKDIEKELHNKFSNKKVRGEWFNLTQDDLDEIKSKWQ